MFHLPEPLTAQSLSALMKDRRYRDRRDPENKAYRDFVTHAYRSFYGEGAQAARVAGGIVHVRPYDRVVKGQVQHVQGYERHGPSAAFSDKIAAAEKSSGYGAFHKNKSSFRLDALGKYQVQRTMLRAAGWLESRWNWSNKAREFGVTTDKEFLQSPEAQEGAWSDALALYEDEAQRSGFFDRADRGETIAGRRGQIAVTQAGVIAAMHREGGPNVVKYFAEMDRAKRASRPPKYDSKNVFDHIETRLREFQDVPYTRVAPPRSQPQRRP